MDPGQTRILNTCSGWQRNARGCYVCGVSLNRINLGADVVGARRFKREKVEGSLKGGGVE